MNHLEAFRDAISAAGLTPPAEIIGDGKLHRFSSNGRPKDESGWYKFFDDDRPAGAFGCWRSDLSSTWKSDNPRQFTQAERDAYKQRMREVEAERAAELVEAHRHAASEAARMWAAAKPAEVHPYIDRKQISGLGARVLGDELLIPMKHSARELVGLQRIYPDGQKRFIKGTPLAGAYCTLGTPSRDGTVVIIEGWATGVSVHMATGYCVVVAFNAGNLAAVARKIRAAMPAATIILGADDDAWTDGNPGVTSATEAALAIDALLAVPRWYGDRPEKHTDFNDLHADEGLSAVAECIQFADHPGPGQRSAADPVQHAEPSSGVENSGSSERGAYPSPADVAVPAAPSAPVILPGAGVDDFIWPKPINIFTEMPVPDLKPGMLPAVLARYAFDQSELIGVTPAMIGIPSIVACASVIHDGIEIQPKRHETGWRESARLWCAVVGSPSVRKSPSLKRAISRLKKINKDLCEDNDRKAGAYKQQMECWKEEKRLAKANKETPPEPPVAPEYERLIVEDVTIEALSEILKQNARGVLCVQDELTGWFGSMDAYNGGKGANKDRAHWLEIYNGGHRMVDRVMRGNVSIPNWSACMVGGIQPDMIKKVAANMGEDGLMQRFMIIVGGNTGNEQDRPEDTDAKLAYGSLIERLHRIMPSDTPTLLSDGAHEVRERLCLFANELSTYGALPGGLKSHLGKWSGLFARLLLTYHVIDCCEKGLYPTAIKVAAETAERVENLMRGFLLPHAMAYYTDIIGSASDLEHVRWIAGYALSKGLDRLESRDLVIAYRQWRGMDEWRRVRVMAALDELGWVTPDGDPKKGRRMPTAWFVNPRAHTMYAELAEEERVTRSKIRDQLTEIRNQARD